MAEVAGNWETIVVLAASNSRTINVILEWDGAADEPAAEALYAAWRTDYLAVGDATIKSHKNGLKYTEASFALPTGTGAEFGEHAILVTTIAGDPTKNAVINLPMPKNAAGTVYLNTSGEQRDEVKTDSVPLLAYLDNFEAGAAYISDGEHSAGNVVRGRRARG